MSFHASRTSLLTVSMTIPPSAGAEQAGRSLPDEVSFTTQSM